MSGDRIDSGQVKFMALGFRLCGDPVSDLGAARAECFQTDRRHLLLELFSQRLNDMSRFHAVPNELAVLFRGSEQSRIDRLGIPGTVKGHMSPDVEHF